MENINSRMDGLIVKESDVQRIGQVVCCGAKPLVGESLLRVVDRSRSLFVRVYLHRRCLSNAIEQMPLDDTEIQRRFDGLREAIRESGKLFPEEQYDFNRPE